MKEAVNKFASIAISVVVLGVFFLGGNGVGSNIRDSIVGLISNMSGDMDSSVSSDVAKLEGDGQTFHKMAPSTLTFRSTEPLSEFKEVQINGQTVDPSNYTLTEGSTIVTLSIDYLETLDVKEHEITVVSENGEPSANFEVITPEVNDHGFYYNQPYSADVPNWGKVVFFIREDGTYDLINGFGVTSTNTYSVNGNKIVALDDNFGAFHCTISSDGTEIYCEEVQTTLKVSNDTSIAADEDYMYVYKEDIGGYEVRVIDKTKSSYGAIKTGINGFPTVKLADYMFSYNDNINVAPVIPNTVESIGECTFLDCKSLTSVIIPNSVENIGNTAFSGCERLTEVNIPNSVESIGNFAFSGCERLTEVNIPNSVTSIGECAFNGCYKLKSVGIPDYITKIESQVFGYCHKLISITIPSGVTSIESRAFDTAVSLVDITFKGTVEQWNSIDKGVEWNYAIPATEVKCIDGTVKLK